MATSPFLAARLACLFSAVGGSMLCAGLASAAAPDQGLGINLHGVRYWSPTVPFVDVFKQSGEWIPQREGVKAWDTGEALDLDEAGWLRSLSPGQQAARVVMKGGDYPAGRYLVSYDGQGELTFGLDARIVARNGKDLLVDVRPKESVILKVQRTDPSDPVRNIRMYLPDLEPSRFNGTFNPSYLEYLRGFKVVRFMDWGNANDTEVIDWRDRTVPEHASQHRNDGVALEYMLEFAEALDATPWFTVPHTANDDYVRAMARLIKTRLKAGRKFYIEYSNEVWNTRFPQHRYAASQAERQGLRDADAFYVARSLQVFRLFEEAFGNAERFVRVLSGQAVNTWRARKLLAVPELARLVDAYAIAPYFGNVAEMVSSGMDPRRDPPERFLARLGNDVEQMRALIHENVVLTQRAGLSLIAYEAGQHLTDPPDHEGFCAVLNRHPKMEALYDRYLQIWREETGDALMVMFADFSRYRGGCWGLAERIGQDPETAPKLRAVRRHLVE